MVDPPDQFRVGAALERLVHGIGRGESMQHRDPVSELILRAKPADAHRGGVGDLLCQLRRRRAGRERVVQRADDLQR